MNRIERETARGDERERERGEWNNETEHSLCYPSQVQSAVKKLIKKYSGWVGESCEKYK